MGVVFALDSLDSRLFLMSMILVIMSSRFSLLALLTRMDEKISTTLSSAEKSDPFTMTLSLFSKN